MPKSMMSLLKQRRGEANSKSNGSFLRVSVGIRTSVLSYIACFKGTSCNLASVSSWAQNV